jgi:hypothetical protein
MTSQTTADLELEAEAARARMAETASTIRSKLTAGQMLDEFSGMVTGGDLSQGLGKLKDQVRDNPLPLTLIGAGIALLAFGPRTGGSSVGSALGSMFGGKPARDDDAPHFAGGAQGSRATSPSGGRPADPFAAMSDDHGGRSSGNGGEGLADKASNAAHAAADSVRSAADSVRSAAHDASERVSDGTSDLMETADRLGHEMLTGAARKTKAAKSAAADAIDQEPLAIGALGLLLGAVLGATLPVSDFEEEQLGPHAKKLRQGAEDLAERGMKGAGAVASKTYDAVRDEADRQGLRPGDGETVASRVGEVVKAAAETVDETVRSELAPRQDAPARPDQETRARS